MDYLEFVKAELLVLIPVLYALGIMIKNTEKVANKYIPMVLTLTGVLLALLYIVGTEGFNVVSIYTGIVQGVICAAGAVYSNQLIKQSQSSNKEG